MSSPINSYPSTGDREVIPSGLPSQVTAMSTGVDTNHSSTVRSVADAGQADAEGAQWNDDEDSSSAVSGEYSRLAPQDYDPNMSGPHPTEQARDPIAGSLSSWQENDDYLKFTYDTSNVPESRLLAGYCYPTGYRDNTAAVPDYGYEPAFGADSATQVSTWEGGQSSQGGIAIMPVIRR